MKLPAVQTPISTQSLELRLHEKTLVMQHHPVFSHIRTIEDLRTFMSWHVYAVWDFMSLVKRLQIEFTSVTLPWTPPNHQRAARLISEITLGEECDETPQGEHTSHFELYLGAMREIGASDIQVLRFVELVRSNVPVEQALRMTGVPAPVSIFVQSTIDTAMHGSTLQVLGSFLFGREDAIPEMFRSLLAHWSISAERTPTFVYYLNRHIQLDADSHGPAAQELIAEVVSGEDGRRLELLSSAVEAVEQRIALWDALQRFLVVNRYKEEAHA